MEKIVTAEEMKLYDSYTIEKTGIPAMVLMERAAMAVCSCIEERTGKDVRVLVAAGMGNNGGDGLAIGRILAEKGGKVTFFMPGIHEAEKKASKETGQQLKILKNLGFSIHSNFPEQEYDIVIDALFGIGLTREITGDYRKTVEEINRLSVQGAYIVSVDIPSGICADSGRIMGCAVRADRTVAFEYAKCGHYFYPGKEYSGRLKVCPVGIGKGAMLQQPPSLFTIKKEELAALLPQRKADGNKGSFGRVLLVAGKQDMCGAAILCGRSILRTGAGMVKIITPECNREIIQKALPEAMLYSYFEMPEKEKAAECLAWADVIVAGPGMGKEAAALSLMEWVLSQKEKPLVIDADGLNMIAQNRLLDSQARQYRKNRIIMTPHPGELIRLTGQTIEEYKKQPIPFVKALAAKYSCIVAGKDAVTVVAEADREEKYINATGNDGMATAGSGDVLAGIISGLLAQGQQPFMAACTGVCLHGEAGRRAAVKKSRYSVMASDIIEEICFVLTEK